MDNFWDLFSGGGEFTPPGYFWQADILWTHVVSDGLAVLACFLIFYSLRRLVRRKPGLKFNWILMLCGFFVCGYAATLLLSILTVWKPLYRLEGLVKSFTAVAFLGTAIALVRITPKLLSVPSPEEPEVSGSLVQQRGDQLQEESQKNLELISQLRLLNGQLSASNGELSLKNQQLTEANTRLLTLNRELSEARQQADLLTALVIEDRESKYQQLAESITDIFFSVGNDRRFLYWNQACEQFSGLPSGQVAGKKMYEVFLHLENTPLEEMLLRVMENRVPESMVSNFPMIDQNRYFQISAYPAREGITVFCRDITRQRQAEEALHFQASILQNVQDSVIVTDLTGRTIYFNQGAEEIFGYSAAEKLGTIPDSFDPEKASKESTDILRRVREGEVFCGEWQGQRRDGTPLWVSVTTSLLKDASGQATGFIGVSRDITSQKLVQQKLLENEARIRSVFDASVQSFFLLDRDLKILTFNRQGAAAVRNLFKRDPEVGESMLTYSEEQSRQDFIRNVERAFAGEKVLVTRELNYGPVRIWVEVQYLPVTGSEGRVNSVAFVALDITARKQSELELQDLNTRLEKRVEERTARLQQLNGELESFSYSVSHDLAAPLRIISGFSRALLEDYADTLDAEGKEHLLTICSSTQRMKQIMDDLLMLSRVTRREISRETVDLSRMAAEVAGLLEKEHPGRKAEVTIEPDLRAEADTGLVRILLDNLLENAWKYSQKRDIIRVEVGKTMTQQGMAFFVKDNGAGFDMKYAGKLFDAFQRLHSGRDFPGTGVGLATVQRIVTRHGGQIWAWSEPDQGAVFYFTLPEPSPAT